MNDIELSNVKWPAFIKCGHCDELSYVASASQWQMHYQSGKYLPDDVLVDSSGLQLSLSSAGDATLPEPRQLALSDVLEIVRAHASVCGHCCVSKMGAPDIASAVELVGGIE